MKKKVVVMAGGGTGGHVFPIKSLIETINSDEKYSKKVNQIIRFGSKNSLEKETAEKFKDNVKFITILSGKFRRETPLKSHLKNIRDLFLFVAGCFQSIYYLLKSKADVVFCKGGYVALPVVCAARLLRKPIYVHESDVRPGLVNKIANRFSKKTFCGFNGVFKGAEVVGQILSDEIIPEKKSSTEMRDKKSVFSDILLQEKKNGKTSILVMGGSQGSKVLYKNLADVLDENKELSENFNFHVILGKLNEGLSRIFESFDNVKTYDFLSQSDMGCLYEHCDVCLTRGGTTSLAEQKLFNLKSIIVPIPRTHDQKLNAEWYVKNFNDILVEQSKPTTQDDLKNALIFLKDYKKPEIKNDIKSEIQKAKITILNQLLS